MQDVWAFQRFALWAGRFDIPHGDYSHSMNIVNKDGVEAKLPVIVPPFAGDVNLRLFLPNSTKESQRKYKDHPVEPYLVALNVNKYKEQVQPKGTRNRRVRQIGSLRANH